jgi:predicted nuclease of predicted toxin-antitoxin system
LGVPATHVRDLELRGATDRAIFQRAREANAIVLTKDADFAALVDRYGAPPQVLWITAGNTSESHLQELLQTVWPKVQRLLAAGEPLIEITDKR